MTPSEPKCSVCSDVGFRIFVRDGDRFATPCDCRKSQSVEQRLLAAKIPKRYEHCEFENFQDALRAGEDLVTPHYTARKFVDNFPVVTGGHGLLFTGSIGVGKTHLAIAILRSLITDRGAQGIFVDYRDLLKQIQNSYNASVGITEMELLRPVFDAEVLVLDELGATKPSAWVFDTVALILNTRYLDKRTTIFTTNYPDRPAPRGQVSQEELRQEDALGTAAYRSSEMAREETLGDRIGDRMRSRINQMCQTVEMLGQDYRSTTAKQSFVKKFTEDVR